MKYCQGNKVPRIQNERSYSWHERTVSLIKLEEEVIFLLYSDNFCSLNCQSDWLNQNIEHALNHFGRTTEPKKVMCDEAWYKDYIITMTTLTIEVITLTSCVMIYLVNVFQLLNNSMMI